MMGINDTFGESGEPWELIKFFGLSAEHIVMKAKDMLEQENKEINSSCTRVRRQ
jgi:transketolase